VIQAQARRARQLVQSLLAEARAEAVPEPAAAMVDPGTLVERVAVVFERLCREREQVLSWSAPGPLPPLEADGEALEQVLGNVLRNAIQATPPGGRVSLTCRQRGRLVEFVVRDTGPGIPAEHLSRIFEPYFTTKTEGEGTGLGLALAREIVHRHRGTLVVESFPDEAGGAQFVIAFPFDRRARERDESRKQRAESGERRLLLVEDDADLRRALARYLSRSGWSVSEAPDGGAALATAAGASFDVIVCDAGLPDMTGMALHDRLAPSRFVLISGDAGHADVLAFRQRTGVPVLQKPFDLDELGAMLAE
jgi:CheY-like chemotaxis protein